jgi:hypothetical protein
VCAYRDKASEPVPETVRRLMPVCRISRKPWALGRCIGRRYLWGLGAFGQEGVERVLELMRAEFEIAMRQCGVRSVKELSPALVRRT